MRDAVNVPPDQLTTEEANGQWALPSYTRKRMARKVAMGLRRAFHEHQYNGGCNHVNQWDQRTSKSVKQEKSWLEKCREIGLIEMRDCDPEINAVPPQ
eukprot:6526141-Pyramimonas_sp.AAC.1